MLALEVTRAVREREAYAPEILNAALRRSRLADVDARFATALAYGAIETSGALDIAIDRAVADPSRVEPAVRDVLRLGAYELLFMDKPAHVVVDQAVELVKRSSRRATGFTNAVMRRIAADAKGFPWGDPDADDAALALSAGFPLWLVKRLIDERGRHEARAFLEAHRAPAPLYLAVNPFRTTDAEALEALAASGARPSFTDIEGCLLVEDAAAALSSTPVERGEVLVADATAQFIASTIGATAREGQQVLEVGSGRGTKAALIQSRRLRDASQGPLFALDSHQFKSEVLATRMKELRVAGVTAVVGDATAIDVIDGLPKSFDIVSVDAPCSGIGTLRRHPDKRWRVTPDDVSTLAALGSALIAQAASKVAPGGTLFYSTCTVLAEENEAVIEAFLASEAGRGFALRPFTTAVPPLFAQSMMADGTFRSHPVVGGPDGHFAARLVHVTVDDSEGSAQAEQ